MNILGIVGSLRKDSRNHYALKAEQQFDQDGRLTDEPTRPFIRKLVDALVQFVKISSVSKSKDC